MDALEVCISGIVTSLNQCLETSLHQSTYTTAQNSLFTKQIRLGLSSESSLQNTCSCAADTQCISQCQILSLTGCILLYGDQTGNTLTCLVLTPYSMSGTFGSDHGNINVLGRYDTSEMNIETMGEHQHIALFQVGLDVILVQISLLLIIDQDHDDVSTLCSFCSGKYFKSLCLSLCPGLGALVQTDDNMTSGILQVQCVCMTLAAVADNCDSLTL